MIFANQIPDSSNVLPSEPGGDNATTANLVSDLKAGVFWYQDLSSTSPLAMANRPWFRQTAYTSMEPSVLRHRCQEVAAVGERHHKPAIEYPAGSQDLPCDGLWLPVRLLLSHRRRPAEN